MHTNYYPNYSHKYDPRDNRITSLSSISRLARSLSLRWMELNANVGLRRRALTSRRIIARPLLCPPTLHYCLHVRKNRDVAVALVEIFLLGQQRFRLSGNTFSPRKTFPLCNTRAYYTYMCIHTARTRQYTPRAILYCAGQERQSSMRFSFLSTIG